MSLGLFSNISFAKDLAQVNGDVLTDKDLELSLSSLNSVRRKDVLKNENSKRRVLENLINQSILVSEAKKQKLNQSKDYKDALGLFKRQFLARVLLEKEVESRVSDSSAKRYFNNNKNQFSTEQVRAQHILLKTKDKALDILKKVKKSGADFQKLAEKHSIDPSAKNNRGDMGFFFRDRMVPKFSQAAFSAKNGEIVGPIQTEYGFHVIKVIDRKPGKPMEYSEVELRVKNMMRRDFVQSYVDKLRKSAKVKIY